MTQKKPRARVEQYDDLYSDIAGTYRLADSVARDGRISEATARDLEKLDRNGFLVIESLVGGETLAAARAALLAVLGPTGRNEFEGVKTQRAYSLLRKTRALDALVAHPRILALLDAAIGPDPLLSALLAINILPGEKQQVQHYDTGFYATPRPRARHGVSVIWAIDPFTEENGATVIWPGSHKWNDERRPRDHDPHFPIIMSAGSAVIFDGDLWHAGGANNSSAPRLALTPQYCANWLRTIENMSLAVPPVVAAGLSPELQSLIGYQIRPPFVGYVDGMHPKRLLEGRGTMD